MTKLRDPAAIAAAYRAGASIAALAKRLKVHKTTIQRILRKAKVRLRKQRYAPKIPGRLKDAETLIRRFGYDWAARQLKCSRQALYLRFPVSEWGHKWVPPPP